MAVQTGPAVTFEIKATMRVMADTSVTFDGKTVTIAKEGPRGVTAKAMTIPLSEWEQLDAAVRKVKAVVEQQREALSR